jgi:hypothetical protein
MEMGFRLTNQYKSNVKEPWFQTVKWRALTAQVELKSVEAQGCMRLGLRIDDAHKLSASETRARDEENFSIWETGYLYKVIGTLIHWTDSIASQRNVGCKGSWYVYIWASLEP